MTTPNLGRRAFMGAAVAAPAMLTTGAAAAVSSPVTTATAALRALQTARDAKPKVLSYADATAQQADEDETSEYCVREDELYQAVGRATSLSLGDLRVKILVMLEAMGEVPLPNGLLGGAATTSVDVLVEHIRTDVARLLVA